MSTNVIPFNATQTTAVALPDDLKDMFENAVGSSSAPHLSIKGKVWTVIKDDNQTVLSDAEDNPVQVIDVVILDQTKTKDAKITRNRAWFSAEYDGSAQAPKCYSNDGFKPSENSDEPQNLTCEGCKRAEKGSGKEGKGSACKQGKKFAVLASGDLEGDIWSLKAPITSLWVETELYAEKGWYSFDGYMKFIKSKGVVNPAMIQTSMRFAPKSEHPQILFKMTGMFDQPSLRIIADRRKTQEVRDILGLDEGYATSLEPKQKNQPASAPKPPVDELDDIPVVTPKAKPPVDDLDDTKPAPVAEKPKTRAPKKVEEPKPAPVIVDDLDLEGGAENPLMAGWDN